MGDTRSLDYGSYGPLGLLRGVWELGFRGIGCRGLGFRAYNVDVT